MKNAISERLRRLRLFSTTCVLSIGLICFSAVSASSQNSVVKTQGGESPAIDHTTGNVTVFYYSSGPELAQLTTRNVSYCIDTLHRLLITQNRYLLPSVSLYVKKPTFGNWKLVHAEAQATQERLQAAIASVIDYDDKLAKAAPNLSLLLSGKQARLFELPDDPPKVAYLKSWSLSFRAQVSELSKELIDIQAGLANDKDSNLNHK